jgi:polyisoprenoid-binding protein YceI
MGNVKGFMTMRRFVAGAVVGWLVPLAACVAPLADGVAIGQETAASSGAQATSSTVAAIQPGDVNVEVSRVYTFVDKTGLGHQHGIEGRLASGQLRLGASQDAGTLRFDMRSFQADTDAARRYVGLTGSTDASTCAKVTANMLSREVLDVERFPTATLTVDSALATGGKTTTGKPQYELRGRFELHGQTQNIRIPVEVERARGWLHVQGRFAIRQTAYGIEPYSAAFGAVGVADPLVIHGDLWIAPTEHVALETIPERK